MDGMEAYWKRRKDFFAKADLADGTNLHGRKVQFIGESKDSRGLTSRITIDGAIACVVYSEKPTAGDNIEVDFYIELQGINKPVTVRFKPDQQAPWEALVGFTYYTGTLNVSPPSRWR